MFPFFFQHQSKSLNVVDIHSHLIYDIDDGASDIDKSIELIKELSLLGYEKLITTPHISNSFPNSKKTILEKLDVLRDELLKKDISIDIEVGAEYYIDDYFENILESDEILSFGEENYLLFEFSHFTPPRDVEDIVYEMILKGYKPVLAHPERYIYWHSNFDKYIELKDMNVLFQINLNSIVGYYNRDIQAITEKLIKKGMVDFVGSDTHHMTHIKSLQKVISSSLYKKVFKYNKLLNDTLL